MEISLHFRTIEKTKCLMFGLVSEVVTAYLLGERYHGVDVLLGVQGERSPLIRGPVEMERSTAKLCCAAGHAGQKLLYRLSASEVGGSDKRQKLKWLKARQSALLRESSKEYFERYRGLDQSFGVLIKPVAKHRFSSLASALEVDLLPLSDLITSIAGKILALRGIANWEQITEIISSQIRSLELSLEVKVYKATVLRINENLTQVSFGINT